MSDRLQEIRDKDERYDAKGSPSIAGDDRRFLLGVVAELTSERDRAREIAVSLEQEVAYLRENDVGSVFMSGALSYLAKTQDADEGRCQAQSPESGVQCDLPADDPHELGHQRLLTAGTLVWRLEPVGFGGRR